jgi:hypothetical protein
MHERITEVRPTPYRGSLSEWWRENRPSPKPTTKAVTGKPRAGHGIAELIVNRGLLARQIAREHTGSATLLISEIAEATADDTAMIKLLVEAAEAEASFDPGSFDGNPTPSANRMRFALKQAFDAKIDQILKSGKSQDEMVSDMANAFEIYIGTLSDKTAADRGASEGLRPAARGKVICESAEQFAAAIR